MQRIFTLTTVILLSLLVGTGIAKSANDLRGTEKMPLIISVKEDHEKSWLEKFKTDPNAGFAGAIAFFTLVLASVTIWQAVLTRSSIKLTERALNDTERPYLYIFGVLKLDIDLSVPSGLQPFIKYSVANYGKTPAIIEDILIGISVSNLEKPSDLLHGDSVHDLQQQPIYAPNTPR